MQELTFKKILPEANAPTERIMILLHGLGADCSDLLSLAPYFAQALPDCAFYAPNAPYPCDMAPYGYQWFSLQDRHPDKILAGVETAHPLLNNFIDQRLAEHGLTDKNLLLVGFSQGTMMSLYTALRRKEPCAGVIGFSGAMIGAQQLSQPEIVKPPICLIHGEDDPVVPFEASKQAHSLLQAVGFEVDFLACPKLGHSIDENGLRFAINFAQNHGR